MAIDIKRPVYLCGENPGMTLYKADTDQPVAIVSYWHVTYSPHGTGNALILWLDKSTELPGGIFTDNLPLARILVDTLTRHFPEFKDVPVADLPYTEADCEHSFNETDGYIVSCNSGEDRIAVEWANLLDQKALSWPGFPAGKQTFDLQNVICPCGSGTITVNNQTISGKLKTEVSSDKKPSSSAFLAFAESWVGPISNKKSED